MADQLDRDCCHEKSEKKNSEDVSAKAREMAGSGSAPSVGMGNDGLPWSH